jgi:D-alanine-D-alanine ligase
MKKVRVLLLLPEHAVPPDSIEGLKEDEFDPWKTEYDVWAGLCNLGHEVLKLGVANDLAAIRGAIEEFKPHITFNLVEEFHGVAVYDYYIVSYLELLKTPYTGCNPRGLLLSHDKALTKSILAYHRIRSPEFTVFPIGRTIKRPAKLQFPLLVKSLVDEGSMGISQASIVHDDEKLVERVKFVHDQFSADAIVEKYIDGRELYVGLLGNSRLRVLPPWELKFDNLSPDAAKIATSKVKWDRRYQEKVGVHTQRATDLPDGLEQQIVKLCKRIYRVLNLTGYARLDFRMDADNRLYLIEANPNPQLAYGEDFAESAEADGLKYEPLLAKIISLGLSYRPAWQVE